MFRGTIGIHGTDKIRPICEFYEFFVLISLSPLFIILSLIIFSP